LVGASDSLPSPEVVLIEPQIVVRQSCGASDTARRQPDTLIAST
jgi:hypothetical protein